MESSLLVPTEPQPLLRPQMPELDSVRGTAILMVVLYHAFFWSGDPSKLHGLGRFFVLLTHGGWLGVQLFFVLSGFLITGILLDTRERPDYYRRFYERRASRIFPVYIATLFVLAVLGLAKWPFLLISFLFASNLAPLFGVLVQYGPLWSLAVEEQFYLFWPFWVRKLSRRALALLSLAIVILVPLLRWISFEHNLVGGLYSYTWFVADGLAIGALLALFLRRQATTRRTVFRVGLGCMLFGGGMILVGMPAIFHRTTSFGATFQLFPWHFVFAGGILFTLLIGTSRWRWLVLPRWLRYLGRVSYGLYLIHLISFFAFNIITQHFFPRSEIFFNQTFIGLFIRFVIAGGIAVLVAAISREYFEEFFLRRPRRS